MTAAPSRSTRPGWHGAMLASLAVAALLSTPAASSAQMDLGPRVEKTYGSGLPRDRDRLLFDDDQYPVWPLTPEQQRYASIDGARMKRHVVELAQIEAGSICCLLRSVVLSRDESGPVRPQDGKTSSKWSSRPAKRGERSVCPRPKVLVATSTPSRWRWIETVSAIGSTSQYSATPCAP